MDQRLVEAARVGDVTALRIILEEDPQIREKACLAHFAESPLHVAALAGEVDFVNEIIKLLPSLATETNQQGLIPLHMASAAGHAEIVKELLKVKLDEVNQCLLKDDDGWTPLHYAVSRGRVGIIKELIRYCPECVEEVTAKGETVLHLALKANQFGAVEVIVERLKTLHNFQTLFGAKDKKGKTAYELAEAKKQFQVLGILKEDEKGDIKGENRITVEEGDCDPEVSKQQQQQNLLPPSGISYPEVSKNKEKQESAAEGGKDQFEFQNTILVVATLIITLTYQGLLNPPSTLFKQGTEIDWGCLFKDWHKLFSRSILYKLNHCPSFLAFMFLTSNTLVFIESVTLVILTFWEPGRRRRRRRWYHVLLLQMLTLCLIICYCILLMASSHQTVYVVILPLWYTVSILIVLTAVTAIWRGVKEVTDNNKQNA